MNKLLTYVLFAACVSLTFVGCSDKSSDEACTHQVTIDLDHGNYDAVLASSCADSMQRGAAYFGRAGYDINNVINRLIDANEPGANPLNIYMSELVTEATDTTITDLDAARSQYGSIAAASENYKDAQFDLALVEAMKGITLMKLIISVEGRGAINALCDRNGNNHGDEVDAATCALKLSAGQTCGPEFVITTVPNLRIAGASATYQGLLIQVTGTAGSSLTCPIDNTYKRLLSSNTIPSDVVTTRSSSCAETAPDTTRTWPCPVESGGTPLGLAQAFDESLNGSITAMGIAVTTQSATDVQTSIMNIKKENCCAAPEVWNPANPASCTCDGPELGAYLQTL